MIGCRAILPAVGLLAISMCGCWATSERGIASHDPVQRRRAMVEAAAANDEAAVRNLIARLDSQDPGERLVAIRSLERITGTTCDYDHASSAADRAAAVVRWTEWAKEHGYAGHMAKVSVPGQEGAK